MGLDAVELVIAIEKEFGLRIPDSEAEKMLRVGDVFRFVVAALRQRGDTLDETVIWTRLADDIVEELGVRPEEVTPAAHFVQDLGIS